MNRHNYQQQQSYSVPDLNKGLGALNLDSNTLKKLTVSGIREFVPQPSQGNQGSSGRFSGSNPAPLRLPNSSTPPYTPSYGSDRINPNALSTPPPSILPNSPRQSPTPASMGLVNQTPDSSASSIAIYNDGGTTYFYPGDEMVSSSFICALRNSCAFHGLVFHFEKHMKVAFCNKKRKDMFFQWQDIYKPDIFFQTGVCKIVSFPNLHLSCLGLYCIVALLFLCLFSVNLTQNLFPALVYYTACEAPLFLVYIKPNTFKDQI